MSVQVSVPLPDDVYRALVVQADRCQTQVYHLISAAVVRSVRGQEPPAEDLEPDRSGTVDPFERPHNFITPEVVVEGMWLREHTDASWTSIASTLGVQRTTLQEAVKRLKARNQS